MSITAINSAINFKGVKSTFKKAEFPEIDPAFKYLFGNSPDAEPTILKTNNTLDLFA